LHLAKLIHETWARRLNRSRRALGEIEIGIIEKGSSVGSAHSLARRGDDPRALKELMPDLIESGEPIESLDDSSPIQQRSA